jgi:hypothetical protein
MQVRDSGITGTSDAGYHLATVDVVPRLYQSTARGRWK